MKTLADFEQAVEVQLAVWGYSDSDLVPKRVFIVAERIGGQVLGAYDGQRAGGLCDGASGLSRWLARTCTRTCWPCCRSIATRGWDDG